MLQLVLDLLKAITLQGLLVLLPLLRWVMFPDSPVPIMIFVALAFLPLCIVVHEMGHGLMARWMGGEVDEVSIGYGKQLLKFRLLGLPVVMKGRMRGGFCRAYFKKESGLKWRYILFVLGGPLANLLLAAGLWLALGQPELYPFYLPHFSNLFYDLLFINLLLGLVNLLPYQVGSQMYLGARNATDGLLLLQIPFWNAKKVKQVLAQKELHAYLTDIRESRWENLAGQTDMLSDRFPNHEGLQLLFLGVDLETLRWEQFHQRKTQLEALKLKKGTLVYLKNTLACYHLGQDELDQALEDAVYAFEREPGNPYFRVTRAAVLVARGEHSEAIPFLKKSLRENRTLGELFFPHFFLYLAYQQTGQTEKAVPSMDWLRENMAHFSPFDLFLWEKMDPDSFPGKS